MMGSTKLRQTALALGVTALLAGCAGPNPRDPYEGFNRAMFDFNDTVDTYALKPVATAYKNVTPGFVQTGVGNFFGNLGDAWSAINNLLQGKGEDGMSDVARFALNTTFGIAGLFDIASEAGLQKHKEDFGQTLGVWGVPSGPYVMLPLLGPSTLRDTAALPVDITGDIWRYKEPIYIRNTGTALRVVDQRASLLDASTLLEDAALDRYEFIRDGFLQRRESQIHPDTDDMPRKRKKDDDSESSAPVSSESAPKELNSGTPAAKPDSQ
ncbi:VacJ family lipoprotein [Duganella sp. FT135W]|uniref:VacJ family lipoprotein n=1 Tax=Duganella flavida TaxID=2692175 RepID=A0A6L8K713_9BURK|nr:VacJ family lipoprotein [Duganella flavida]MYM22775.1 VacJ family lipoprotein [Duganella flavida]